MFTCYHDGAHQWLSPFVILHVYVGLLFLGTVQTHCLKEHLHDFLPAYTLVSHVAFLCVFEVCMYLGAYAHCVCWIL